MEDPAVKSIPDKTHRSLPIALLRAREAVMVGFRPVLARHGVTEQQWRVLRVLLEIGGSIDASNLAARAFVLPPSLTRIAKVLDERGLISINRDQLDGRRSLFDITKKGKKLIETAAPEIREVYMQLESRYGDERISQLLDILDDLTIKLTR